ncbi:MAG: response regulator [Phycisphaerae bacterium]|nr:response regulator [Phycisphaerae bacterium]
MEGQPIRILHLEANPEDANLVRTALCDAGISCEIVRVETRKEFVEQLRSQRVDMVLADYALPNTDGVAALDFVIAHYGLQIPFLFVSNIHSEEIIANAFQKGAMAYVAKNRLDSLPKNVRRAFRESTQEKQHQQDEETLRESERWFRMITDVMPQIVWTASPQDIIASPDIAASPQNIRVDYINRTWGDYTGLPKESWFGTNWIRMIHPDDLPSTFRSWEQARKTSYPLTVEHRILRKDGSYRWFLTKAIPVRDEQQCVAKWLGISTDIHDQKMAQEQLKKINELLEQRVEERTRRLIEHQEQLRAMTSDLTLTEQRERRRLASELHDYLAQLLVACKMKIRLLTNPGPGASSLPSSSSASLPPKQTLAKEINELLEQSIKYTRTLIAELSPTILYEVGLQAALRWLAEQMEANGLQVDVQEEDGVVSIPDDQAVLIFQTVRELLLNVAKHAMTPKATLKIQHPEANQLKITVLDHGVGFDTSAMEGPSAAGKYGLFSIRERLEALGGQFEIASEPGQGTQATLTVRLQQASPVAEFEALSAAEFPAISHGRTVRRRVTRVLLADDHHMVREGLRSLIESEPRMHVVGEAANGEQVIQQARILHPDVVVMDINMPKINGIEATRRITEELPATAVVALSMHEDRTTIHAVKEAGAVSYVPKDSAAEELSRAIRSAHLSVFSLKAAQAEPQESHQGKPDSV